MKKVILFLSLAIWCPLSGWAEEPSPLDGLPGYYQFTHDDPVLGSLSLGGFALSIAGLAVATDHPAAPSEYWVVKDGRHYFNWVDTAADGFQDHRALSGLAVTTSLWGSFFSSYGAWNTYLHLRGSDRVKKQLNLTMADYLAAPFDPQQVFNADVFPVLPLLTIGSMGLSDYAKIGGFFSRESVNFAGYRVSPLAGLGLAAASSLVVVAANATLEEIVFRGVYLDRFGVAGSSVVFGANHLLNAFVLPNFSFEEAALQSLGAGLFGWYAADRTEANNGDFRRMMRFIFGTT